MILESGRIPKDDEYEIEPLDLSSYALKEITKKIANEYFTEETTDSTGNYMLRGHWLSDMSYQFAYTCEFKLCVVDSYSSYAYSDEQMVTFTYCEGDITLTPFADREKYEESKKSIINFYKAL